MLLWLTRINRYCVVCSVWWQYKPGTQLSCNIQQFLDTLGKLRGRHLYMYGKIEVISVKQSFKYLNILQPKALFGDQFLTVRQTVQGEGLVRLTPFCLLKKGHLLLQWYRQKEGQQQSPLCLVSQILGWSEFVPSACSTTRAQGQHDSKQGLSFYTVCRNEWSVTCVLRV